MLFVYLTVTCVTNCYSIRAIAVLVRLIVIIQSLESQKSAYLY